MREITLKELLEAGCHFGHQVNRSNPKSREFVYASRDKVQIVDLVKTKEGLEKAGAFVKATASQGGRIIGHQLDKPIRRSIIFLGTKRQAKTIVEEEAKRCGAFYVVKRWVGGLLTNWEEVKKNLKRMEDLRENLKSDKWTKREKVLFEKGLRKLEGLYGGIEGLNLRPDLLYIVDTHREEGAVKEANKVGVPVVGIVDTNADPRIIDYAIPANDDAVKSIQLITSYIADAVIEGREMADKREEQEKQEDEEKKENEEKKEVKEVKVREKKKAKATAEEAKETKSKRKTPAKGGESQKSQPKSKKSGKEA